MLKRLIAHQVTKEAHSNTAQLNLRQRVLPVDSSLAGNFLEQLRDSFQKRNPAGGLFKSTGGTQPPFQQMVLRYLKSPQDKGFLRLSREGMTLLKEKMASEPLATGGYVVFAEYEANDEQFLLIALLSTMAKPSFDDSLNLVASTALDLDHLRHGTRIRMGRAKDNSEGVLQFISQKARGVSEYFVDFVGCEEVVRPEAQGRFLYTALDSWAQGSGFEDEQRGRFMAMAYEHWQECRREGRTITLTALANRLSPEEPEALLQHLGREEHQLAGEFSPPPPSVMKRFVRFAFNAHGLKLEFDRNQWENRVTVNPQAKTLTIADVPDDLIAAFKEHE